MDKNTILGMLLMGAVILGFMWLNQPSAEERARMEQEAREMAEAEAATATNADNVLTPDSVSASEIATIRSTVNELGTADAATGMRTLSGKGFTIDLASDGALSGSVSLADGTSVSVTDILTANYGTLKPSQAAEAVKIFRKGLADAARYRGFAAYLHGDSATVRLANKDITLEISNKGGAIASAMLNDYKTYDSIPVMPIATANDSYGFILTSASQRFDTREFYFTPIQESDTTVLMNLTLGDGASWGIRYTLPSEGYLVKMDIVQQGMQNIIPTSVATVDFVWDQRMDRNEEGIMFEQRNSGLYYMYANGDVDHLKESGAERKEINERLKWIGYKNQFFSAVIVPATTFTTAELDTEELEGNKEFIKHLSTHATMDYSSMHANPASFTMFLGPNSYPLLSDLQKTIAPEEDLHLTKLIPLGWSLFRWINTLIVIPVFDFLGRYISSYGIIILLLTIFIKIILFPFTYKSYMSQAKMRVLAPDIKAINEKYPGKENAMKRQQETMALYSRAGASPFSGCLPMLLQMPILIAMFNFFPSAIELRGESFLWAKDLSAPDAIVSWSANIPFISSTFGNHISLFCLLMTAVNIIYTRINMQNQASNDAMPGMKWMMYLMPLMFLVFFNNYASGLSYYYFLSLLITIAQTFIFRRVVNEEKVRQTMRENAKKPRKKSGFMARLEEAQRQQQAMLREQEKQRAKKRR
ncbi:MAG: membrane protein insertase YidC [Muribaculaceae bacterium]|nr:membrane protein insertase YidC [Muribaculaceae bacterium]